MSSILCLAPASDGATPAAEKDIVTALRFGCVKKDGQKSKARAQDSILGVLQTCKFLSSLSLQHRNLLVYESVVHFSVLLPPLLSLLLQLCQLPLLLTDFLLVRL